MHLVGKKIKIYAYWMFWVGWAKNIDGFNKPPRSRIEEVSSEIVSCRSNVVGS